MPLIIASLSDKIWYPVTVTILDADGRPVKHEFEGRFLRCPQDDVDRRLREAKNDTDLARGVLVDWRCVQDGDGSPIPFSADARDAHLNVAGVGAAVARAWLEAHSPAGRAKN